MKREYDIKLTCEQIVIIEKVLAEEIDHKIFYALPHEYTIEDIMKHVEVYKKFKEAILDVEEEEEEDDSEYEDANDKIAVCHESCADELSFYEQVFNGIYPEGSIIFCNYDPNKILPGEWAESVDNEGYWKRIK